MGLIYVAQALRIKIKLNKSAPLCKICCRKEKNHCWFVKRASDEVWHSVVGIVVITS